MHHDEQQSIQPIRSIRSFVRDNRDTGGCFISSYE
jgi:hypothetical protein